MISVCGEGEQIIVTCVCGEGEHIKVMCVCGEGGHIVICVCGEGEHIVVINVCGEEDTPCYVSGRINTTGKHLSLGHWH